MLNGRKFATVLLPGIVLFFALPASAFAQGWTATGGGDHGGLDWTPADNLQIAGVHININQFRVAPGTTVYVAPWNSVEFGGVDIQAESISIEGTLNASGAGHGGGAGGSNDSCCNDNQNGATAGTLALGGAGGNAHWSCGGT